MKINEETCNHGDYKGNYYEEIGNFIGGEGYLQFGFTKGTVQEVDFLIEVLQLPPGSSILDIGCGPGRHSLEFARRGYKAAGIDISFEFIRYANEQAAKEKINASFQQGDARTFQTDQSFSAAICLCEGAFGLAGSLENHLAVLHRIHKALDQGGLFVLTVINAYHLVRSLGSFDHFNPLTCTVTEKEVVKNKEGAAKEVNIHTTAFTYREMKLLLESAGFETVHVFGCTAGEFSRKALEAEDMEMMIVARKK